MFFLSTPSATSGWIATPIAAVRQGGERRSVPELIEVFDLSRLIFEVLSLRERVMIFLGFGTGLPRGELGGIKWEDIDFETGQLHPRRSIVRQHVGKTKTEASRNIIPVDEHLLADLRAWRRKTPYAENADYIFASPKMKGKQPLWLDTVIKKIVKPAAAKAGIRLKGWHTLRHTYSNAGVYDLSNPLEPRTFISQPSLSPEPAIYMLRLVWKQSKVRVPVVSVWLCST